MDKNLVSLLQIEGAATDKVDLDGRLAAAGLLTYSMRSGYYQAMVAVVTLYKPARALRELVDGVNVNAESVAAFRACADRFLEIVERMPTAPSIMKALIIHNAASCYGRATGNKPEDQEILNSSAMVTLHALWGSDAAIRDTVDWYAVYYKVAVGLYEQGARSFDEADYRALIDSMEHMGSKDAAGRRLFLARRLQAEGRVKEAAEVLAPLDDEAYESAPVQVTEARSFLAVLRRALGTVAALLFAFAHAIAVM